MAVSSAVRRDAARLAVRVVDWLRRAPANTHGSSGQGDDGRLVLAAVAAPAAGLTFPGSVAAVRWTDRGLELHTGVAIFLGLAVLGCVVVLIRFLDRQHEVDGADRADVATDEMGVPVAAGERVHVATRPGDDEWPVRIHRLETVAEGSQGTSARDETAADVEALRDVIDDAGLRAIRDAAIRLYEDGDGRWHWSLVRSNGTTLATAARASETRSDARDAVTTVTDHGPNADVLDARTAAFAIIRRDGRWYWQLLDDERTPLAESTDGYPDPDRADAAIDPFLEALVDARVVSVDRVGVELYEDGDDWSWRFVDEDHDVLADATERYDTRRDAETAADEVRSGLESAAVTVAGEPAYERYREGDCWHWRLVDGTGRVVARSSDVTSSRDDAERTADLFAEHAPDADVLGLEDAAFEVFSQNGPDGSGGDRVPTAVARDDVRTDGASPSSEQPSSDADVAGRETATATDPIRGAGPETPEETSSLSPEETASGSPGETTADRQSQSEYDRQGASSGTSSDDAAGGGDGWYWRLVTAERDVVAVGPEPAADAEAVGDAIERVREQAREAELIEFEDAAFRVYETDSGEWRWRLIDEDGSVLADSGTEHDSRTEAAEAMVTLKQQAPDADVLEIETAAFELFVADDGWRWRLIDSTGKLVALGPAVHPTRDAAQEAMTRLLDHLDAAVHRLEGPVFQPYPAEEWRWRFVLPGGDAVAVAGGGFTTRDELVDHIAEVRAVVADAGTHEVGSYSVQLADRGDWGFRVLDRDREPIADGTARYSDRDAVHEAVEVLQTHADEAPIFASDTAAIRLERAGDEWHWTLVSSDCDPLGVAVDTLETESMVRSTVDELRRLAPSAGRIDRTGASFDLVELDDDRWRWRLLDGDGELVATAADSWTSTEDARDAVDDVRSAIERASVLELEGPAFELYVADDGWRWRLVDATETGLLESTQAYETRAAASDAVDSLQASSLEEVTGSGDE
ncbi:DUF1508 domain-containing protein [Natrarchaeobaculum aegyptiacum]|uniref:DUF1508 domain-containing protein n=1 Tax=Natrarchaeobaculum aegyptiacum TaxID=745377 RepID=A0A2Z2HU80_9EURY|nr:DUF1508 domain-containing protein [Natrarchaeobaculum aegyptiacum]ARS90826.1 hypothetical protein B1756_14575 [Natrarchaeobaculum aegyptiacum]